jgi:hypothetical protein
MVDKGDLEIDVMIIAMVTETITMVIETTTMGIETVTMEIETVTMEIETVTMEIETVTMEIEAVTMETKDNIKITNHIEVVINKDMIITIAMESKEGIIVINRTDDISCIVQIFTIQSHFHFSFIRVGENCFFLSDIGSDRNWGSV